MSTPAHASIALRDVTFAWPDGSVALAHVDGAFTEGRTGLVGRNGSGKSTLLRLIAGDLTPTSGRIDTIGDVGYLPQTLTLHADTDVARLLGVDRVLAALRAIESGNVDEKHFDTVGDDWDLPARIEAALERIGLSADHLDRRVADVSGGEAMLLAVAGLSLRRTPITLLDEPTNNLDRATRARLADLVDDWPGTLIVVSHDLELLEHMEATAELYDGSITTFGGPYSAWRESVDIEQAAAVQAARTAHQALKSEKKQRVDAETRLAHRARTGKKAQADGGLPKILAGARKRRAQESAGALRGTLDGKVESAQAAVDAADARIRDDDDISLDLPTPDLPRSRRLIEFATAHGDVVVQGPERVAVVGPNGSGKSTLLTRLVAGDGLLTDSYGYLPQRLDGLDETASALTNVQSVAPDSTPGDIRNRLARLLIRGAAVDRPVSSLSGGERFRVCLAKLLFAEPPPTLLILDEPTNNLDVTSVRQLTQALDAYRGALLIVSHDYQFLREVGIDIVLELDADGTMRQIPEL